MSEPRGVNPLVEQFRKGAVPPDLRLMAAQGALPLKTLDLIELLLILERDRDEQVTSAARSTLGTLPAEELREILSDRETPGAILAWALSGREEHELLEVTLQNRSTPDEAIEAIVATLPESLAELVVINQVRLLRRTSLLEALESNASLNNDQKRRLRELRESFHIGTPAEHEPAPAPAPSQPAPAQEPELAEEVLELEEPAPLTEEEAIARTLTEEERKQASKVSAVRKLHGMNTMQKMMAALKGSREERSLLIRDPNKLVFSAVLGSPLVTEAEVESFSNMKSIQSEVLRQIGGNREWVRKYPIMHNLVKNPRTPVAVSMGMVPRLNPRDLKALATDRNVPEPIRKAALRFVKSKLR